MNFRADLYVSFSCLLSARHRPVATPARSEVLTSLRFHLPAQDAMPEEGAGASTGFEKDVPLVCGQVCAREDCESNDHGPRDVNASQPQDCEVCLWRASLQACAGHVAAGADPIAQDHDFLFPFWP